MADVLPAEREDAEASVDGSAISSPDTIAHVAGSTAANDALDVAIPHELPFLESLSWFDAGWRTLSPLEMLQRYESGWRHRGVTGDPSPEEMAFIRALAMKLGSTIDVST